MGDLTVILVVMAAVLSTAKLAGWAAISWLTALAPIWFGIPLLFVTIFTTVLLVALVMIYREWRSGK